MKKFIKSLSVLLCMTLVLSSFIGCTSDIERQLVGTWSGDEVNITIKLSLDKDYPGEYIEHGSSHDITSWKDTGTKENVIGVKYHVIVITYKYEIGMLTEEFAYFEHDDTLYRMNNGSPNPNVRLKRNS